MTSSAYHPFGYGQGFPTTLMIPAADRAGMHTYKFIAHETAHQWWGDNVVWRSYRDQWLSEKMTQERIPDSEIGLRRSL